MGSENTPNDKACAPENPPSRLSSFGSRGTDALKDFRFTVQRTTTCRLFIRCVPVVVSHSRSTQQQMDQCCRGLIVRAWFADDDLEPESADIEIWRMEDGG